MANQKRSHIVNRVTGKSYPVTAAELEAVKTNPLTKKLYDYKEVEEPEEVTKLRNEPPSKEDKEDEAQKNN